MTRLTARTLAGPFTAAVVGVVATAATLGGGFAFAAGPPPTGAGVAETLADPDTVNSEAIINGTIRRADIAVGTVPLWARVRSDGTLITSRGVTNSSRLAVGTYQVDFRRDIDLCAWIVTATDNDAGSAQPGSVTAERRSSGDFDSLEIRTFNSSGTPADRAPDDGFAVMVSC